MTPESLDRLHLAIKQEELRHDAGPSGDPLLALAYSEAWAFCPKIIVAVQFIRVGLQAHGYLYFVWPEDRRN